MERSHISLKQWVWAIYLSMTSLKGVSSMKLHRDLGITQKSAWFMAHRIREAMKSLGDGSFYGPVEVDETHMGGRRRNMHREQRERLRGRGATEMTTVIGVRDRPSRQVAAQVIPNYRTETVSRFVMEHVEPGSRFYTDEGQWYSRLPNRESVRHRIGEYVRGEAHTNGIESFWAMLKRAHKGTFHKISPKHLNRYVTEFVARHNLRDLDTIDQMREVVARMVGRRLMFRELTGE